MDRKESTSVTLPGGENIKFVVTTDRDGTKRYHANLPPQGIKIKSLDDLKNLPGMTVILPPDGIPRPTPNDLLLHATSFVRDTSGAIQSAAIQVRLLAQWFVISDGLPLALTDVRQDYAVIHAGPGHTSVVTGLSAIISLGGMDLRATVSLPYLELEVVGFLSMGTGLEKIFPSDIVKQFNELSLPAKTPIESKIRVVARGDLRRREWSVACGVEGTLTIGPVALTDLHLIASYRPGAELELTAQAAGTVAGAHLSVTLHKSQSWLAMGVADNVKLADLSDWAGKTLGIKVPVCPDITINLLGVDYDFASRAFSFSCDSTLAIGDDAVNMILSSDITGKSKALRVQLALGGRAAKPYTMPMHFNGTWVCEEGNSTLTADWQGPEISLLDIARSYGIEIPAEFPDAFLPSLSSAGITYSHGVRGTNAAFHAAGPAWKIAAAGLS